MTISKERIEAIAYGSVRQSQEEGVELARMVLSAMDSSESVELPLDYLQGHKDGLEWAARLAEANHPETGDWLYDDPIELAKAIRKGPDMPPAQPVADSEPVAVIDLANLDYLLSGADADVWPPEREEMGDVLLYRHAQPAPVVPEEWTIADAVKFCKETGRQDAGAAMDAWNACRAAMLNHPEQHLDMVDHYGDVNEKGGDGNSPVIPDGWTCNDKANAALMMLDRIETVDPVDDDRIDGIKRIVRELAAAPHDTHALNSVQSVVTVPGEWIPVSERVPTKQDGSVFLTWNGQYISKELFLMGSFQCLKPEIITHWMPLPAAPQEVK